MVVCENTKANFEQYLCEKHHEINVYFHYCDAHYEKLVKTGAVSVLVGFYDLSYTLSFKRCWIHFAIVGNNLVVIGA